MKQFTLPLNLSQRRTRKREFLDAMERVVLWTALLALIAPLSPRKHSARLTFALQAIPRIHFVQQWFKLLSLATREVRFDVHLCREFAGLGGMIRLQDRVSILRFRRMLEEKRLTERFLQVVNAHLAKSGLTLKEVTKVDATLIAAHYPTKNQGAERNPAVLREGTLHSGQSALISLLDRKTASSNAA